VSEGRSNKTRACRPVHPVKPHICESMVWTSCSSRVRNCRTGGSFILRWHIDSKSFQVKWKSHEVKRLIMNLITGGLAIHIGVCIVTNYMFRLLKLYSNITNILRTADTFFPIFLLPLHHVSPLPSSADITHKHNKSVTSSQSAGQ
jgi:hypothetical protein